MSWTGIPDNALWRANDGFWVTEYAKIMPKAIAELREYAALRAELDKNLAAYAAKEGDNNEEA
jgi:hypothetical protein